MMTSETEPTAPTPLRQLSLHELQRPTPETFATQQKAPIVLVLDSIRSLQNVGACFRIADAFAIRELILCGYTGHPPHRDIYRAALGAEATVAWRPFPEITDALDTLQAEGYQCIALEQTTNSVPLPQFQWNKQPLALVLGNEIGGVSENALTRCQGAIEIPQFGTKHSLNVSVACGIALYHMLTT